MLNQSAKQAAELAMSELIENSGDESGKDHSQERVHGNRGNSKKPKKALVNKQGMVLSNGQRRPMKGKKGKKIYRNNFMTSGGDASQDEGVNL